MHIRDLKQKLPRLEERQQPMVSLVSGILQKPALALNRLLTYEDHGRKRRLPRAGFLHEETNEEDNQMVTLEPRENANGGSVAFSNMEQYEQLESSIAFWEDNLLDKERGNLFLELNESPNCVGIPTISCWKLSIDAEPKSPVIDVHIEPAASIVTEHPKKEALTVATAPTSGVGVNDVYWKQFLTENPGSTDAQAAQSERKDMEDTKNDVKPVHHGLWWKMRIEECK